MSICTTFTRRRQLSMASRVATVIRLAFAAGRISTLFGLEGTLKSALRADLCLRGWHWDDANQAAGNIMSAAHGLLGAERPSWYEGQADYVIAEGLLIERTRCKRCHKTLPEERPMFCSFLCKASHHNHLANVRNASADNAVDIVIKGVKSCR